VTVGPFTGIKVDKKAPDISIISPSPSTYTIGQMVLADYACNDAGSGIASCSGSAAVGGIVDTSAVGEMQFSVLAADVVGNVGSATAAYSVSYGICSLYSEDAIFKGGSIPIKLQLCDASGANISSPAVTVSASGLTRLSNATSGPIESSGNANPDYDFRYDATLGSTGGYIYNLSAKELPAGRYRLHFTVTGDPVEHAVEFQVS